MSLKINKFASMISHVTLEGDIISSFQTPIMEEDTETGQEGLIDLFKSLFSDNKEKYLQSQISVKKKQLAEVMTAMKDKNTELLSTYTAAQYVCVPYTQSKPVMKEIPEVFRKLELLLIDSARSVRAWGLSVGPKDISVQINDLKAEAVKVLQDLKFIEVKFDNDTFDFTVEHAKFPLKNYQVQTLRELCDYLLDSIRMYEQYLTVYRATKVHIKSFADEIINTEKMIAHLKDKEDSEENTANRTYEFKSKLATCRCLVKIVRLVDLYVDHFSFPYEGTRGVEHNTVGTDNDLQDTNVPTDDMIHYLTSRGIKLSDIDKTVLGTEGLISWIKDKLANWNSKSKFLKASLEKRLSTIKKNLSSLIEQENSIKEKYIELSADQFNTFFKLFPQEMEWEVLYKLYQKTLPYLNLYASSKKADSDKLMGYSKSFDAELNKFYDKRTKFHEIFYQVRRNYYVAKSSNVPFKQLKISIQDFVKHYIALLEWQIKTLKELDEFHLKVNCHDIVVYEYAEDELDDKVLDKIEKAYKVAYNEGFSSCPGQCQGYADALAKAFYRYEDFDACSTMIGISSDFLSNFVKGVEAYEFKNQNILGTEDAKMKDYLKITKLTHHANDRIINGVGMIERIKEWWSPTIGGQIKIKTEDLKELQIAIKTMKGKDEAKQQMFVDARIKDLYLGKEEFNKQFKQTIEACNLMTALQEIAYEGIRVLASDKPIDLIKVEKEWKKKYYDTLVKFAKQFTLGTLTTSSNPDKYAWWSWEVVYSKLPFNNKTVKDLKELEEVVTKSLEMLESYSDNLDKTSRVYNAYIAYIQKHLRKVYDEDKDRFSSAREFVANTLGNTEEFVGLIFSCMTYAIYTVKSKVKVM
jgi:hypothetical protein